MTTLATPALPFEPARPTAQAVPQNRIAFALFLLVNAALFIRPGEIIPDLKDVEVYQFLIIACFVVGFPAVLDQFQPHKLESRPTTLCVLALLPVILLSNFAHGNFQATFEGGFDFFKVVVYYLLFVGLVDSPQRIRTYLGCMAAFATVTVGLATLHYHEIIHLPDLKMVKEGQEVVVNRMQGTGLFHDPNEVAVLVAVAMPACLYWLTDRASGVLRLLWLFPMAVLGYGLVLTQSRGGLLALLLGLLAMVRVRFGTTATVLLGLLLLPGVAYVAAGRMTSVGSALEEGTGRSRLELWSDGLEMFRSSPLVGVGRDQFQEFAGHVAHNSYLHAFSELGVVGGLLFVGAFWYALSRVWALRRQARTITEPTLARLHPYLLGMLVAQCVGMMSLSLCYNIPTYTMLGLATGFLAITPAEPPLPPGRVDGRFVGQVVAIGAAFLGVTYVVVRLMVRH